MSDLMRTNRNAGSAKALPWIDAVQEHADTVPGIEQYALRVQEELGAEAARPTELMVEALLAHDARITPTEFVHGFKRAALRMQVLDARGQEEGRGERVLDHIAHAQLLDATPHRV